MIMETTKLTTIEDVNVALDVEFALDGAEMRAMKPAERRQRASRIADLYEMRASMWFELGVAARKNDRIPDAYASACAVAENHDHDRVKYWRHEAGAR